MRKQQTLASLQCTTLSNTPKRGKGILRAYRLSCCLYPINVKTGKHPGETPEREHARHLEPVNTTGKRNEQVSDPGGRDTNARYESGHTLQNTKVFINA